MAKSDYPARQRPPATKVEDAKPTPEAAKKAVKKQLGRNGRSELTFSREYHVEVKPEPFNPPGMVPAIFS